MAQRVQVQLIDDLDNSELSPGKGETVTFALDGRTYEIDLGNRNAKALRSVLAVYIENGRRVTARRSSGTARPTPNGADAKTVKDWARKNGYEVNERGRVPSAVRQAYDEAH